MRLIVFFTGSNLFGNRWQNAFLTQLRASAITVNTTAYGHIPVTVWAGKTSVNLQFMYITTEQIAPVAL